MFHVRTKCKLNFSTEQTYISFEEFNVEWLINSPMRDLLEINNALEKSNPPFRLEYQNNEVFAILKSYSEFCEYFLKLLVENENKEASTLLQGLRQNESEIYSHISKFNKLIKDF